MNIKKIAAIVLSLTIMSAGLNGTGRKNKNVSQLGAHMEKYESVPGFEYMKIGKFLLGLAKGSGGDEADAFMEKVTSILMLEVEEGAAKVKKETFMKEAEDILENYIKLVDVTEDGEKISFYIGGVDKEKKIFHEIVTIGHDEKTSMYMVMTGKFDEKTIEEIEAKEDKSK